MARHFLRDDDLTPAEQAQVLITTQQRIEHATGRSSFEAVSGLYYRGSARQVRVWDEAWLPGVPVTLTGDDILLLVKPMRPISEVDPEFGTRGVVGSRPFR